MHIIDVIFPRRCLGCGKFGKYFCDVCRKTIRVVENNDAKCPMCGRLAIDGITHPRCVTPYGIDGLTSFFHYDGIIRKAIKAVKYHHVFDISKELIALISHLHLSADAIIPIPLHRSRQKDRGYNQAEILGRILAHRTRIPMITDCLERTRKTTPQVDVKSRNERVKNMEGVFGSKKKPQKHIIIFDDVFTTGATMRSAARVLKQGGATWVWAVTIAR